MYPVSGVTQVDRLERASPAWQAEWIRLNELLQEWRSDSNNRELTEQIKVSLERVGIIIGINEQQMKLVRTASIYPSADEINALPEKFRRYVHDLETRCDKSGDVQTIALLHEDREVLQKRVEELDTEVSRLRAR
jgi:hypothetical protein